MEVLSSKSELEQPHAPKLSTLISTHQWGSCELTYLLTEPAIRIAQKLSKKRCQKHLKHHEVTIVRGKLCL